MYAHVRISSCCRALIRLVAAATIRERRLFRSALAQVRLLFESGVYSREASIRSYTVYRIYNLYIERKCRLESQVWGSLKVDASPCRL